MQLNLRRIDLKPGNLCGDDSEKSGFSASIRFPKHSGGSSSKLTPGIPVFPPTRPAESLLCFRKSAGFRKRFSPDQSPAPPKDGLIESVSSVVTTEVSASGPFEIRCLPFPVRFARMESRSLHRNRTLPAEPLPIPDLPVAWNSDSLWSRSDSLLSCCVVLPLVLPVSS